VDDPARIAALAQEHLPTGVTSAADFVTYFRRLLTALSACEPVGHVVADVVAWLRPDGAVQHHVALRCLETGELCCLLDFGVVVAVDPIDLDVHAECMASVLTEALNLSESSGSLDGAWPSG
jgi:hypothetical protein